MNAFERRVSTCFAPALLDEMEQELAAYTLGTQGKGWKRMHDALNRRRAFLLEHPDAEDLLICASPSLPKRKDRMTPIREVRADKSVWLLGWHRKASSRKAMTDGRKMLKSPICLVPASDKTHIINSP